MSKTNKIIWGVIVVVAIILIIVFGGKVEVADDNVEGETIKIGVATPLSGLGSEHGTNARKGLDLALKEINNNNGIGGKLMEFVYEDTQCDPKISANAVNKLVNIDGVKIIIGQVCSSDVLSTAKTIQDKNILIMAATASSYKLSEYSNIFRTYPSDILQGKENANFIINKLQSKRVGIFYINNDYGVGLKQTLRSELEINGVSVVAEEAISFGNSDFKTQLLKVKNANPDVVFLGVYSKEMGLLLKQAKEIGLNVKFMGGITANDPNVLEIGDEITNGLIGSDLAFNSNPVRNKFLVAYRDEYGQESGIGSANAYDIPYLIKRVVEKCLSDEDVDCLKKELLKIEEYEGASGKISFDENGDVIDKEYNFVRAKDGEFVSYEK